MMLEYKQLIRAAGAVLSLTTCSAAGQALPLTTNQPPVAAENTDGSDALALRDNRLQTGFSLDYSYVAGSDATFQNLKGNSDAQSVNVSATMVVPVNDKWFVPFRISSHNLFLGTVADMPIPDQINTLGFDVGLGYHLNEQWSFVAEAGPRLYRFNDINGDDFGAGGIIMATYKWKPNLKVALGINFATDREVPVLPAAGLQWDICPDFTLDLMWPRTALIYHVAKPLDLFVGVGGNYAVFRADPNLGNNIGQPAFNNALGTYRDFHIGVGAEYRFFKSMSFGIDGGYSVGRHIDYTDIDQSVSFDPSPYVQVGLKWRF